MSRRKRGQDIHGWVLINKPSGVGSTQVVAQVRRAFDAKKAGHGGTLDPDATGLLPIALGDATKFLPLLEGRHKTYRFEVTWGSETATDDASGEILRENDLRPSRQDIEAALVKFRGDILQVPPQVSAVKVQGKRAYDLVREGANLELKARPLFVERLEIVEHYGVSTEFVMTCGKGGYVRSIGRDLGREIGSLGHVKWLHRSETLGFREAQAQLFDGEYALLSIVDTPGIGAFQITQERALSIANGHGFRGDLDDGYHVAMCENLPIAILRAQSGLLVVERGLHGGESFRNIGATQKA